MSNKVKISASILSSDFTKLGEDIRKCEDAGVDMIHVDVMDGHFCPNISIGLPIIEAIRPITKLPIDTHLMIENPGAYIQKFADAGSDYISTHIECYGQRREHCRGVGQFPKEIDSIDLNLAKQDMEAIRALGKKAMVVVNPGTPLCFDELFDSLDGILIMSVNPGFSGQKFMAEALPKIKYLAENFKGEISVDGGVNAQTAPDAVKSGVTILATASYFFGAEDPKAAVDYLRNLETHV